MLGKQLATDVPTTAVALLALRDRSSEPFVNEGLEFLERHATSERSAMALALASRALDVSEAGRFLGHADPRHIELRGETFARFATQFDVVDHFKPIRLNRS